VFKKYGVEICCGGKKSLRQACRENNLDIAEIEKELIKATTESRNVNFDFNRWEIDFLADYIYNEHHRYWYDEEPVISELVQKVVSHHGATHPELNRVADLYSTLKDELTGHFLKEEQILFPHIKELVKAKLMHTSPISIGIQNIDEPLQMMEAEHEAAGGMLAALRKVTRDYTLPVEACNSYGLLYHKLKSLEEDLHQHIHLENNILFPKAALLHKELIKQN
jgi:regulator of cell morphogenesis and NO signaling